MNFINSILSTSFNNNFFSSIITIILLGYASLVRKNVPLFIVKLFDNPIFRILILSLIIYKGNKDPKLAIFIAIAFTVTMNLISKQKIFENFTDTTISNNRSDSEVDLYPNTTTDSTVDTVNEPSTDTVDLKDDPTNYSANDATIDPTINSTNDPTADTNTCY